MGWRALAPCVTSPHPETDRLEALSNYACACCQNGLRYQDKSQSQKSKVEVKDAQGHRRGDLALPWRWLLADWPQAPSLFRRDFAFGPMCLQPQKKSPTQNLIALAVSSIFFAKEGPIPPARTNEAAGSRKLK